MTLVNGYFIIVMIFLAASVNGAGVAQTESAKATTPQNEVNPSIQNLDPFSKQTDIVLPKNQQDIPSGFWGSRNPRELYQHKDYGVEYYNNGGWPFYQHQDYRGSYQGYSQMGSGNPNYYYQYNNDPYYYKANPRASFPYKR